jgi:hypothetical protein
VARRGSVSSQLRLGFNVRSAADCRLVRGDGHVRGRPRVNDGSTTPSGRNRRNHLAAVGSGSMFMPLLGDRRLLRVMVRHLGTLHVLRMVTVMCCFFLSTAMAKRRWRPRTARAMDGEIRNPRRSEENRYNLPRKTLSTATDHHELSVSRGCASPARWSR